MGLSCFETVMISRNIWTVNGGCPGGPGHIIAADSDDGAVSFLSKWLPRSADDVVAISTLYASWIPRWVTV